MYGKYIAHTFFIQVQNLNLCFELTTILQKIVIVTNNNAWKIGTGAQQSEIRHFDNLQ
jgi:hypothetical protein